MSDDHIHPPPSNWFWKYVFSTDHKIIGKQYLFTSLIFLLIGGSFAMMIRWQLAFPNEEIPFVGPIMEHTSFMEVVETTNEAGEVTGKKYALVETGFTQLVTMHGAVMIFFVIIPILVGAFGNFLIPLHIGARDVAFPFLNALSYWLFLPSALIAAASFFVDGGPAQAGWTGYPPLSGALYSQGPGTTMLFFSIFLLGFSSILGGLNFLTTIIKMRAPGMTWSRLPLVTWAQFVTAIFQTLATPVLASVVCMAIMDRVFGTSFFLPAGIMTEQNALSGVSGGGHPLMWQHIFWFYSHPAVYILILPAMGIASELIATNSRKPIFGYTAMVASLCAIMGLGFIVWGHHMFISGMSPVMGNAFMITTMLIALPSGIKVFNWLSSIWRGNIRLTTPMLYALSFVALFIIGGLSGIFMAATPVDIFIHDTYYVVAHFHYVVFGGTLFAVFGGIYFWFPKMFGRMMNDFWAKVHWFLTFVAFNLAFFPMHFLGEGGAPRRYAMHANAKLPFLNEMQWMNMFITMAAFTLGAAQLIFVINFLCSVWFGKKAESNPWQSNTLEWSIPVPMPYYNFEKIPTVYHGAYEYSSGKGKEDWIPQDRQG